MIPIVIYIVFLFISSDREIHDFFRDNEKQDADYCVVYKVTNKILQVPCMLYTKATMRKKVAKKFV